MNVITIVGINSIKNKYQLALGIRCLKEKSMIKVANTSASQISLNTLSFNITNIYIICLYIGYNMSLSIVKTILFHFCNIQWSTMPLTLAGRINAPSQMSIFISGPRNYFDFIKFPDILLSSQCLAVRDPAGRQEDPLVNFLKEGFIYLKMKKITIYKIYKQD